MSSSVQICYVVGPRVAKWCWRYEIQTALLRAADRH